MTRTILFTTTLASAVALFALGAEAQQSGRPAGAPMQTGATQTTQPRMGIAEIATMLEGQGYTLREIAFEHGRYEVEMTDAKGMRVEAYLDPATGAVLPYRDDDDSYRDGDRADRRGDDDSYRDGARADRRGDERGDRPGRDDD